MPAFRIRLHRAKGIALIDKGEGPVAEETLCQQGIQTDIRTSPATKQCIGNKAGLEWCKIDDGARLDIAEDFVGLPRGIYVDARRIIKNSIDKTHVVSSGIRRGEIVCQ